MLRLGGYNFDRSIVMGTYGINKNDVFTEWVDAYGTIHREISGHRTSGQCDLYFRSADAFEEFRTMIRTTKNADGSYAGIVEANNTGEEVEGFFFLSFEPIRNTVGSEDKVLQFTLTLEEKYSHA